MNIPFKYTVGLLILAGCIAACWPGCHSSQPAPALPRQVDFNFHIKPILSDRCFKCHGPDEGARKADLRLDTREGAFAALKDEDERYAIVPGKPDQSMLVHRITSTDPEEMMPPPDSRLSLSPYEIALLKKWIAQGAEWKEHWAFLPPEKSPVPVVKDDSWPRNEIDHFVWNRMQQHGLAPSPAESKEKWLRRVSFDLTGLPPSPEELEAFLANEEAEAYEQVVDRLLASEAYGERMAPLWLDAARYADSHGYQDDRPRTMWPWRDWVIQAFNQNMPYDSFLIWQLAGDLLPHATYEQKLATGFNRNHAITQEGGVVNEEYITEYVADRTNTFATAVLGLTLQCARCHDHKYDPFSQRDYYQLFAYFNTLDERGQINYFDLAPSPNMRVEDAALEAQISWLDAMINLQEQRLNAHLSSQDAAFDRWASSKLSDLEAQALLGEGLQAHYTFDSFSALSSPNEVPRAPLAKANTGLVRELEAPQQVAGKLGAGLRFDGHNFMNLGDVGDFEWHEHFSLGAWIWTPQAPQKAAALLSRRNGEQKRGGYELLLTPGRRLQASLIHNFRKERITVQSTGRVKLNSWTHVALTYDGSGKAEGLRLYLNGRESPLRILEDQLNRQSILTGNDFLAGHWTHRNLQNGELQGFEGGSMDDIRLYSRTLSGYEVGLMAGRQPSELPLKEAYPLYLRTQSAAFRQQAQLLDSLRSEWREVPYVMIMQEADSPRATHLLRRGAYDAPGERVYPGTPAALPPMPPDFPPNRLGLARWLCLPDHPLTARVMVNRCWQIMFGRGLVNTAEDFGSQGEIPSHPALLDWLAVDFVENGWNVKRLMKQIALSATYRQSARIAPSTYKKDPANIWLARGPNQRLSAEMLRDNALAISGLLHREVGGKWVKPYQPPGLWRALANQIGENKYRPSKGHRLYRRSLYTYWKRTIPPPMMLTFDAAERTVCVVKRQSTNTPLQALVLLNDPQFVEASRLMGARMLKEGGHTPEERLRWGFRLATSRWPSQTEQAELMQLWHTLEQSRRQNPQSLTKALLEVGAYPLPEETEPDELLLYTLIANTLLNLDEAKMKS